jgi:alkylation response protein AidB-like acyl-CoA dehydrogenase
MNFDLSEEQLLFQSTVERFVAPIDVEARRRLRGHDGGYDRARWRELAELGLIALAAGEDQGGMAGSISDLALVAEALGQGNAPDPWLENGILPARLLAAAGRSEALAAVMAGESIIALAFAERRQRYSLLPQQMIARAQGDGFVLSGEKTFVLGGALADHFLVTTNLDGAAALFLVPRAAPGLSVRSYDVVDGSLACELQLADVAVASSDQLLISAAQLAAIIADMRLLAAAELMGLGQRLHDDTLAYVKQREQFGVAIGSFQALQHRLVDCYAALEQARSMVYRTMMAADDAEQDWPRRCAGARAYVSEQVGRIAREAVQMHGGMGITDELHIGHAVKRVLLLARLFGDDDALLAEYAEAA